MKKDVYKNALKDLAKLFDYASRRGYHLHLDNIYETGNTVVLFVGIANGDASVCKDVIDYWKGLHNCNKLSHNFKNKDLSLVIDWNSFVKSSRERAMKTIKLTTQRVDITRINEVVFGSPYNLLTVKLNNGKAIEIDEIKAGGKEELQKIWDKLVKVFKPVPGKKNSSIGAKEQGVGSKEE